MTEDNPETNLKQERLCSEIQLFDLCDLDSCNFKRNRFCNNEELLNKFESIREEDDRPPIVYCDSEDDDNYEETEYDDSEDYEE